MSEGAGRFIVFEGVDGSGKSTQAFLLTKFLGERKVRVLPTREPGGTDTAEKMREILLDPGGEDLSAECELLLYMASRAQHVERVIKPSLEKGIIVVCERYNWSSIAYQGYAGGLPIDMVEEIGRFATEGLEPDLTVVLDIDPEIAVTREMTPAEGRSYDRIERKGVEFQHKVRAGFLELARRHPERSRVVDASLPAKRVHEEIQKLVANVL
ncbi:MAG: dTMP kinase [Planctomycetota bacterium]